MLTFTAASRMRNEARKIASFFSEHEDEFGTKFDYLPQLAIHVQSEDPDHENIFGSGLVAVYLNRGSDQPTVNGYD